MIALGPAIQTVTLLPLCGIEPTQAGSEQTEPLLLKKNTNTNVAGARVTVEMVIKGSRFKIINANGKLLLSHHQISFHTTPAESGRI